MFLRPWDWGGVGVDPRFRSDGRMFLSSSVSTTTTDRSPEAPRLVAMEFICLISLQGSFWPLLIQHGFCLWWAEVDGCLRHRDVGVANDRFKTVCPSMEGCVGLTKSSCEGLS
eukprot:5866687-Amphidinium_carterae.1